MPLFTAYIADNKKLTRTKVHLYQSVNNTTLCGISADHKNKEVEFCANDIEMRYIECKHCKKKGMNILKERLKKDAKNFSIDKRVFEFTAKELGDLFMQQRRNCADAFMRSYSPSLNSAETMMNKILFAKRPKLKGEK